MVLAYGCNVHEQCPTFEQALVDLQTRDNWPIFTGVFGFCSRGWRVLGSVSFERSRIPVIVHEAAQLYPNIVFPLDTEDICQHGRPRPRRPEDIVIPEGSLGDVGVSEMILEAQGGIPENHYTWAQLTSNPPFRLQKDSFSPIYPLVTWNPDEFVPPEDLGPPEKTPDIEVALRLVIPLTGWPRGDDFDELVEIEELLAEKLPASYQVDGNECGEDEFSIFLYGKSHAKMKAAVRRVLKKVKLPEGTTFQTNPPDDEPTSEPFYLTPET